MFSSWFTFKKCHIRHSLEAIFGAKHPLAPMTFKHFTPNFERARTFTFVHVHILDVCERAPPATPTFGCARRNGKRPTTPGHHNGVRYRKPRGVCFPTVRYVRKGDQRSTMRSGWSVHEGANVTTASVFRICEANVQGLDVQEAHIRARSKSERAPMKTFMYVQNLELRACTPLVPGIFWRRKIQNFGAPGMNAGVRPKHERIRTNTFTYVQVLDVHGKY